MSAPVTRKVIRVDGTTTDLPAPLGMQPLLDIIGADCADTVNLRHMGHPLHVMIVDDTGMVVGKPVNAEATRLYRLNCVPGTTHSIHGDVVIVPDEDFA